MPESGRNRPHAWAHACGHRHRHPSYPPPHRSGSAGHAGGIVDSSSLARQTNN
ncbi:hypothetical protein BSIN_4805 [Burkholderia singularis]|uniref:Uncharacterized protein n=1 Tax=Burkholderia singularis TaxID=1503053 RepID=A0A238H9P2_9BURK|nr:hypothetical protein BSIN_4805 [Burkholderia singularis]